MDEELRKEILEASRLAEQEAAANPPDSAEEATAPTVESSPAPAVPAAPAREEAVMADQELVEAVALRVKELLEPMLTAIRADIDPTLHRIEEVLSTIQAGQSSLSSEVRRSTARSGDAKLSLGDTLVEALSEFNPADPDIGDDKERAARNFLELQVGAVRKLESFKDKSEEDFLKAASAAVEEVPQLKTFLVDDEVIENRVRKGYQSGSPEPAAGDGSTSKSDKKPRKSILARLDESFRE